jgi:hypothetical protein
LSEALCFDRLLKKASGSPGVGPPGPGLFEKFIGRKRNVDGGVLAGRFLDRESFAKSFLRKKSGRKRNFGGLRFKVHRN